MIVSEDDKPAFTEGWRQLHDINPLELQATLIPKRGVAKILLSISVGVSIMYECPYKPACSLHHVILSKNILTKYKLHKIMVSLFKAVL